MRIVRSRPLVIVRTIATFVAIAGFVAAGSTWTLAQFTSAEAVAANSFSAGTVALSDNDGGSTLLSMTAAKPGDIVTSCIRVTFTGTGRANVRLYGTTTGTGLDAYLNVVVSRGTNSSGTFGNCGGFVPDASNYVGAGNGVIYSGTLAGFADTYAAALTDPTAASAETWTSGETHDYRFIVTMGDSDAAQGKTAGQSFTWEATSI